MNVAAREWHARAVRAAQAGDLAGARDALTSGFEAHGNDPHFQNDAANLLLKMGDASAAAKHFEVAARLMPDNVDIAINHAIALTSAGRVREALAELARIENGAKGRAIYWSTQGNAAREAGEAALAERAYTQALALEPRRPKALHGRALIALERGNPAAMQWFERALAVNSGDPVLWLGKAQALDVAGDHSAARAIVEALIRQTPGWAEGLKFLAQLRSDAGESDFTAHYHDAMTRAPANPTIARELCALLTGLNRDAEAADVAAEARISFPNELHFAFLEAIHASAAGQLDRAETIFGDLQKDDPERLLHEARHRIRMKAPEAADMLLDRLIEVVPSNVAAWALRVVTWRLLDHPRLYWLIGDSCLSRSMPLDDAATIIPEARELLHELHDRSPFPLGQSLRGGTQTRANLFHRTEPVLAKLHEAIMTTVERYRTSLPPRDDAHPFLQARDDNWAMAGSWSVRLQHQAHDRSDYHAAHIHPEGLLSSALYIEVPETDEVAQTGWLEIGRPAANLMTDLEPLTSFEPKPGHLALFPSIMYHGTRPFASGRRMSVAFDIQHSRN
ncbi:MAG: tetratricopeptide repeat protein [Pontixanthobacter sp.]